MCAPSGASAVEGVSSEQPRRIRPRPPGALHRFWPAAAVIGLLLALWTGPLPRLAAVSFTTHMALHLGLVLMAAPLAVFALARAGALGRDRLGVGAALGFSAVEMLVVWSWHAPALHAAAALNDGAFTLQQASFLLAGMLVWLPGVAGRGRAAAAAGTLAMLGSFTHMTMLGVLLALAPGPIYPPGLCGGAFGLDALMDQRLGGVMMALGGGLVYLGAGIFFAARLLRDPGSAA